MSPNNTPKPATDFSNYAWTNGVWRGDSASIATGKDARIYLGVKGRDRKTNSEHYVSVEISPAAARELAARLVAKAEAADAVEQPKTA